jgi:MoaD family protein
MKVKVKYTAQLKKAVGKGEEQVELEENSRVKDLLNVLFQQRKEAFENMVFSSEGTFLDAVLLIVNGQQITYKSSDFLTDGDEVLIMSPIAGG